MGSALLKQNVSPDSELHSESLHRPTVPCCDTALNLQQRRNSVRDKIRSAILREQGIKLQAPQVKGHQKNTQLCSSGDLKGLQLRSCSLPSKPIVVPCRSYSVKNFRNEIQLN